GLFTIAPCSVFSSSGSPRHNCAVVSMKRSTNSLYADRSTNRRDPHKHTCPWFANDDRTLPVIAASRSASAKMMLGFFPPSSSDTFLNNDAHASATLRPVAVPPVNEMVLIFGCAVIAEPTFGPVPWTMLRTPFGRPASRAISHSMQAVIGVNSLGLATAVFPTAMAGAIFQLNK